MKLICAAIARQEKRTDCILRIFTLNDKNPLYLPIISTLRFFEDQSNQGVTNYSKTIWHVPNVKNGEVKLKENARFCESLFYFSVIFLDNTTINYVTNPGIHIINVACKYLTQCLGTSFGDTTFQYAATLSRGKGPDLLL